MVEMEIERSTCRLIVQYFTTALTKSFLSQKPRFIAPRSKHTLFPYYKSQINDKIYLLAPVSDHHRGNIPSYTINNPLILLLFNVCLPFCSACGVFTFNVQCLQNIFHLSLCFNLKYRTYFGQKISLHRPNSFISNFFLV